MFHPISYIILFQNFILFIFNKQLKSSISFARLYSKALSQHSQAQCLTCLTGTLLFWRLKAGSRWAARSHYPAERRRRAAEPRSRSAGWSTEQLTGHLLIPGCSLCDGARGAFLCRGGDGISDRRWVGDLVFYSLIKYTLMRSLYEHRSRLYITDNNFQITEVKMITNAQSPF